MDELTQKDGTFRLTLMLVRTVFAEPLGKLSGDALDPAGSPELFLTCRGETVKSREEQLIADWLFFNGVNYQYEASYKVATADAQHSQYHPDFYYRAWSWGRSHFDFSFHRRFRCLALVVAPVVLVSSTKSVFFNTCAICVSLRWHSLCVSSEVPTSSRVIRLILPDWSGFTKRRC